MALTSKYVTVDLDKLDDDDPANRIVEFAISDKSNPNLYIEIKDNDGELIDLRNKRIQLVIRKPGGGVYKQINNGTISSNPVTRVWFTIPSNTLVPGITHVAYVKLIDGDSICSSNRFSVVILE